MNATVVRGAGFCLGMLAWLAAGQAPGDEAASYFRGVRSRANVFVSPDPSAVRKVAVLPFKAPTELIGTSVSDLWVTELMRMGFYELLERAQMSKVLSESELALAGLSVNKAVEVGAMLGADGVIVGTVDEYSTVALRGSTYPVVGITLRLIDCQSSKVTWSADLAQRAATPDTTLPSHGRAVVHEMAAGVYQKVSVQKRTTRGRKPAPAATDASGTPPERVRPPAPPPPPAAQPPDPPKGLKASDMGIREVTLKWEAPVKGVTEYIVERATAAAGPYSELARVQARRLEYRDAGGRGAPLADSTTYHYRLIAVTAAGLKSAPTEAVESMTAPPPDPPAKITAETPSARTVRLSWPASTSEAVVKYVVERADAAAPDQFRKIGEVPTTSFADGGRSDSGLADSANYLYRVAAANRLGVIGAPSAPVTVTTRPPPAAVTGLVADSGGLRCVPLRWAVSLETDVARYDVYRAEAEEGPFTKLAALKGQAKTNYLDGGADPGNLRDVQTCYYRVRAVNAVGAESPDGETVSATTRPPPPAVEGLQAVAGRPREVPLSWKASNDEKVTGYEIRRAETDGGAVPKAEDFKPVGAVRGRDVTTFVDRGRTKRAGELGTLADGTAYGYQVAAVNAAGALSPWSEAVAARTKPPPGAPAAPQPSVGQPRAVTLTWATNPEADVALYVVEASTDAKNGFREVGRVPVSSGGLRYAHAGLPNGASRFYRLKAVDQDTLESAWSPVAEGATKPAPTPPTDLKVEWTEKGARLTWTASPQKDIKEYKLWKKARGGGTLLATPVGTEYVLNASVVGKKIVVELSAEDQDGLESERSTPLELTPPVAAP